MKGHSYLAFIALVITVAVAFVIIDFILSRKRRDATTHDRKVVSELLESLPADGRVIVWLKEYFISKSVPIKYLSTLDDASDRMRLNVIGLDNTQANQSYNKLQKAIEEFHSIAIFSLFSNPDHTVMEKSPEWPHAQWAKASAEINEARRVLVVAYDEFVTVCHKYQLT